MIELVCNNIQNKQELYFLKRIDVKRQSLWMRCESTRVSYCKVTTLQDCYNDIAMVLQWFCIKKVSRTVRSWFESLSKLIPYQNSKNTLLNYYLLYILCIFVNTTLLSKKISKPESNKKIALQITQTKLHSEIGSNMRSLN